MPTYDSEWNKDSPRFFEREVPYPTRAEFNALVQKVDEIRQMLKELQPNVVQMQPFPTPNFIVTGAGEKG